MTRSTALAMAMTAAMTLGGCSPGGSDAEVTGRKATSTSTSTSTSSEATTASTTTAPSTTTEPPTTTSVPPPTAPPTTSAPQPPPAPEYSATITPLTDDIHALVSFAGQNTQAVVELDVAFDSGGPGDLDVDANAEPAYIFVCAGRDPVAPDICIDGAEVLIAELTSTPDASLSLEHGQHRLRGRFAVQAISGPRMGILSLALRAVAIA